MVTLIGKQQVQPTGQRGRNILVLEVELRVLLCLCGWCIF